MNKIIPMNKSRLKRNGAVMPLLAIVLATLLVIVALTINSNWLLYNQINVQNTADLSARASLVKIISDSEFEGRIDRARDLGTRLYNLNIDRPNANFESNRVRFGNYTAATDTTEAVFNETNSESDPITSVFVDTPDSLEQRQVNVFFSNILGAPDRVSITADATVSTRQVDIILCLDASRSMTRVSASDDFPPNGTTIHEPPLPGSRWFELRETVALFLEAMQNTNPSARVGLVTFGGGKFDPDLLDSDLDLELARFENELTVVIAEEIGDLVGTLDSYVTDFPALGLGTSLFDGIQVSRTALANAGNSSQHIIMLSDGQQVIDNRPEPIVAADAAALDGITIHTISLGGDFGVMSSIADATGGSNFSALSQDELGDAFASLLGRFRVQLVE